MGNEERDGHDADQCGERAQARHGELLADAGDRVSQPFAARAVEHPRTRECDRRDRRPADHAVVAVEEDRDDAPCAPEVVAQRRRARRTDTGNVGRVRRRAAEERLVQADHERDREEGHLGADQCQQAAARVAHRADRGERDHDAGRN